MTDEQPKIAEDNSEDTPETPQDVQSEDKVESPSVESDKDTDEKEAVAEEAPVDLFNMYLEPEIPFEEEIIDISELTDYDEYSPEERSAMLEKYAETMKVFRTGELVMGKIVAINDSDVAVDIGFKSEGSIPVEEFDNISELKVGDEIEVFIDSIEDSEGTLLLSKKKAEFTRVWEKINNLYLTGEMVEAQIVRRIKGGMVVDLFGVEAFLPGSQIDVHPVRDFDALVGVMMDFRIIKVNNARKNVVLSHKVLVEESLREIREKVLSELEEGQVVEGIVKNITDFGVFVDLGGVDGLLHITDLSWGRVSHPSDVVSLDEKIMVKVLRYDKDKQRISLGLKQLKEQHWDEIEEKYSVGVKVKGKVVSIVKYGAFVELEEGVEGLVHISEMSWTQHIKHPSQMVNVNDEIEIIVLNIDRDDRKISLGMKQVEEDPWERLEHTYKIGSRHKGLVRDLVPFGAFVELEPGIDGLIHISDLSWVRKVRHPGEVVKKGQEIEVVVLNFDRNERRIALGFKQLDEDPWDGFEKAYPIRVKTEGSVIRVLEKGVVVMLPLGVEGFVPNSQLGKSLAGENKKNIKEGDNLELEVIEFDKINHRIVLSHSMIERQKDRSNFRAYKDSSDEAKTTIGDIIRETEKAKEEQKAAEAESDDVTVEVEVKEEDAPEVSEEVEAKTDDVVEATEEEPAEDVSEAAETAAEETAETSDPEPEDQPKDEKPKKAATKKAKAETEKDAEENDEVKADEDSSENEETAEDTDKEDKPKKAEKSVKDDDEGDKEEDKKAEDETEE